MAAAPAGRIDASLALPASAARAHSSSAVSERMERSAMVVSKFALRIPSPASAHAKRVASAHHFSHACSRPMKLPLDLDIFSASTCTWPLQKIERGYFAGSSCQTAAWL